MRCTPDKQFRNGHSDAIGVGMAKAPSVCLIAVWFITSMARIPPAMQSWRKSARWLLKGLGLVGFVAAPVRIKKANHFQMVELCLLDLNP
jgi:uncharacterized membrane protein HdeD (DUF308 family)